MKTISVTEVGLDKILLSYSNGDIAGKAVQEATGLSFGEILFELAKRELKLPRFDSTVLFNKQQKMLYDKIFSPLGKL